MFNNNVAIVTGGAGALGGAVVQALLVAGATVVVPHQHPNDLEQLRARLGLAADAALHGAVVDLTDEDALTAYYASVAQIHGGIDMLVNIAGGFAGGEPVHKTPWSLWQGQLDINLKTTVLSCHAAVPHMLARGGGAIVNVGTRTATQSASHLAAYAASKRAVLQLTEALAAELRDQNITANAILPSVIDTPANRAGDPNADHSRWVAPEAIARVILFLLGPDSRIISGAHIPVYGRA
ncbi:MAG: SDR family NAD(P)-dependent oxidoreductase [Chloroflexaceae bacterium]|jgi:NAD(P)-dependent dehydrogenase (short-subunit alcohol dehydrogenase family)|nr:SDR family NAD(P)-dependent oxidoreductase [Chloroflexaceae bacterium]